MLYYHSNMSCEIGHKVQKLEKTPPQIQTIMFSVDFEETGHKLLKIKLEPGNEIGVSQRRGLISVTTDIWAAVLHDQQSLPGEFWLYAVCSITP
ncbi:hypothetical protein H5410_010540 [Solanum commersonii]|uniref:Uncharacterized protein n=1 Tax=Solanum commersonii TaxID=4109 RepID=A0A9J6AMI4_SOLCO|nr:hypothetical protein H5410_010540 [Solanum commersonii]